MARQNMFLREGMLGDHYLAAEPDQPFQSPVWVERTVDGRHLVWSGEVLGEQLGEIHPHAVGGRTAAGHPIFHRTPVRVDRRPTIDVSGTPTTGGCLGSLDDLLTFGLLALPVLVLMHVNVLALFFTDIRDWGRLFNIALLGAVAAVLADCLLVRWWATRSGRAFWATLGGGLAANLVIAVGALAGGVTVRAPGAIEVAPDKSWLLTVVLFLFLAVSAGQIAAWYALGRQA